MSQRHRSFRLSDGTVVFDIIGSDSGNENDEDIDDEELDDDIDDDDDDELDGNDSSTKAKKSVTQLEAELAEAIAKADRADRRMRRADRAKSKTVNELNALKNGGQKELAEAQEKIAELEARLSSMSGTDVASAIREEFRDIDTYDWENRKLAFSLLDLDEVDVDDNGAVDIASLKDAVEKLAKEHPYLVRKSQDKVATENEDEDEQPAAKSGAPVSGQRKTTSTKNRAMLEKKFPQLIGRF